MQRGFGFQNRRNAAFNPATLFAGGTVQGAWYDPSDLTTLFQDSAGTTPVTAVEQAVGLMLDKSKGLVLGSELNGDPGLTGNGFWLVTDPSITVGSGKVSYSSTPTNNALYKSPLLTAGKFYQITITIANRTAGGISIETPGTNGLNFNTNGTFTCRVRQQSSSIIYFTSVGTTTLDITSISIRELPGNHAYQSTSASRPTLRARYNLLTYSEQFDNAAWTKSGTAVNTAAGIAPDGTNTANKIYPTSTGAFRQVFRTLTTVAMSYVATVYAKAAEKSVIAFVDFAGGAGAAWFNLSTGIASNVVGGYTATITSVGNGWYRCSLTGTAPAGLGYYAVFVADSAGSSNVTANGTDGVLLWGAQLVPTAVFPSNVYQRIGAATDYATGAAFPPYLFFDGTDDSMLTNSVDFTGTDKMLVVAGVTKNSDAAVGVIAELSSAAGTLAGAFIMHNTTSAPVGYRYAAGGSGFATDDASTFTAPITNVVTGISNFAGATINDEISMRVNGATPAQAIAGSVSTGNFGNYPLYIGRRNNASLPFNGNIYSLIIAGQSYSSGQISSTESWVAAKTPLGTI